MPIWFWQAANFRLIGFQAVPRSLAPHHHVWRGLLDDGPGFSADSDFTNVSLGYHPSRSGSRGRQAESSRSVGRPLLLRSDVAADAGGGAREPVPEPEGDSSPASSGTYSPSYHPLRSRSGGDNMRVHDAYVADVLAGVVDATEEEKEYIFPQGVMDRLAVQEALSDAAHRRRKRKMDEAAELDDAPDGPGGSSSSRRLDDPDGGGHGAAGGSCPLA